MESQTGRVSRKDWTRRKFLGLVGVAGLGIASAACATPAAPSPTAPKPTQAPPKADAAPKPAATAAPKAAAPTPAPAKRTFQPADVKIAYSTSPRVESARLVGMKQGFFREFGINIDAVVVSGTPNILRSMISEEATFGSGDAMTVLSAIETGSEVKFLGTYEATLPFVVFVRPEIKRLKDLEGKSMGTTGARSLADNITHLVLRREGVDPSKIEFVAIQGTPNVYRAVVAGKIEGGLAQDAFLATATRDGVVPLIKVWEALPKVLSSSFIVTEQSLKKYRDELVRTLAAFSKTFRFVNTPASKAVWVDAATKELQQESGQAETAWQGVFEAKTYRGDLAITKDEIDYMQQLNIDAGNQKRIIPFENLVDLSVVKDALALAGAQG